MRRRLIALAAAVALASCRTVGTPAPEARKIAAGPDTAVTVGGTVSVDAMLTR